MFEYISKDQCHSCTKILRGEKQYNFISEKNKVNASKR